MKNEEKPYDWSKYDEKVYNSHDYRSFVCMSCGIPLPKSDIDLKLTHCYICVKRSIN